MSMKPDNLLFYIGVTIIQNLDLTLQPKVTTKNDNKTQQL